MYKSISLYRIGIRGKKKGIGILNACVYAVEKTTRTSYYFEEQYLNFISKDFMCCTGT